MDATTGAAKMTDTETAELYNLISQLRANKRKLEARIAELEARECRLLTEEELNKIWKEVDEAGSIPKEYDEAIQRKFAEVNNLKVKE